MTPDEAEAVRDRACTGKVRFGDPRTARAAAENVERESPGMRGHPPRAYRCAFCSRWHVGHVPSMENVTEMALAIRVLGGNAPGEPGRSTMSARKQRRLARRGANNSRRG